MSDRAVSVGDKFHIITRRLFVDDVRRHFAGEVLGMSDGLYELQGYTFVFQSDTNEYRKRSDIRTRIFALSDAHYIVNKLPPEVEIASLEYRTIQDHLVVTDSRKFFLDINEFGASS